MGGNQSKSVNRSSFTSEQAYNIAADINAELNVDMKADAKSSSTSKNSGVTFSGIESSNLTVSAESKARVELAQSVTISLDFLNNSDVSACVALDVLNGLKSAVEQQGGGVMDKTESENVTETTFKLSTSVSCCQNLQASIGLIAVAMAEANAINENIKFTNIKDSTITVSAKAEAEALLTQLADLASKAAGEMSNTTSSEFKQYNDLEGSAKQEGALKGLENFATNLTDEVAGVANNLVDEVGETAREGIGMVKWLIIGPIIGIIAIIALIIVFKLAKGGNKNQMPMNYPQMQYNQYQPQQQMNYQPQQQMQYQPQQINEQE